MDAADSAVIGASGCGVIINDPTIESCWMTNINRLSFVIHRLTCGESGMLLPDRMTFSLITPLFVFGF